MTELYGPLSEAFIFFPPVCSFQLHENKIQSKQTSGGYIAFCLNPIHRFINATQQSLYTTGRGNQNNQHRSGITSLCLV